jgi:hypothetical protein
MNILEIRRLKSSFVPLYPEWLLKLLSVGKYNKTYNWGKFKFTSKHVTISILVGIILIMLMFSKDDHTTAVVWVGSIFFILFSLCILMMIGFSLYNNQRIKKICKANGISIKDWNLA